MIKVNEDKGVWVDLGIVYKGEMMVIIEDGILVDKCIVWGYCGCW